MPKLLQTMVESNKERELCLQNKVVYSKAFKTVKDFAFVVAIEGKYV